VSDIFKLTNGW